MNKIDSAYRYFDSVDDCAIVSTRRGRVETRVETYGNADSSGR